MKKFFTTIALVVFCSASVFAQEEKNGLTWYTDIKEANAISAKTKKPIFGFFTGSDWCGWCKRLQAAVFAKPEFQAWAKKNVVLLELDFPRRTQLPEKLAKQNSELQQVFQVQGYPTVWIFTLEKDKVNKDKQSISALGSLGYPQAEPGKEALAFIATADQILKNKQAK